MIGCAFSRTTQHCLASMQVCCCAILQRRHDASEASGDSRRKWKGEGVRCRERQRRRCLFLGRGGRRARKSEEARPEAAASLEGRCCLGWPQRRLSRVARRSAASRSARGPAHSRSQRRTGWHVRRGADGGWRPQRGARCRRKGTVCLSLRVVGLTFAMCVAVQGPAANRRVEAAEGLVSEGPFAVRVTSSAEPTSSAARTAYSPISFDVRHCPRYIHHAHSAVARSCSGGT